MFKLLDKKNVGTIQLSDKVKVSDPCYDAEDTYCSETLENVLPGKYQCFRQKADMDWWGHRISSIEVRHQDYQNVEPTEIVNQYICVDSGQCGIYDLEYFIKSKKEDEKNDDSWYGRVCKLTAIYTPSPEYKKFTESKFWKNKFQTLKSEFVLEKVDDFTISMLSIEKKIMDKVRDGDQETIKKNQAILSQVTDEKRYGLIDDCIKQCQKYIDSIESKDTLFEWNAATLDDKCLVSSSGDGDGAYVCLVGRNQNGQIVSIKIDYYYNWDDEDEDEF